MINIINKAEIIKRYASRSFRSSLTRELSIPHKTKQTMAFTLAEGAIGTNTGYLSRPKGFTLSEVLITLAIVGIVASIVIPALYQMTSNAEFKTAAKKEIADLTAATALIKQDNGGTMANLTCSNDSDVMRCTRQKYGQYLNFTKTCAWNDSGNCWPATPYLYFKGTAVNESGSTPFGEKAVQTNGMLLSIRADWPACDGDGYTGNKLSGICGQIAFDVNGWQGPNTIGKDVFDVFISKDGIIPSGAMGSSSCTSSSLGYGCTELVLQGKDY